MHDVVRRQERVIDLQHEPGIDDRAVFLAQRVGQRVQVLFLALVVFVAVPVREIGWRHRRHERLLVAHSGKYFLQRRDVLLQRGHALVRNRPGAHPAGAPGLAGRAGHLRRPGIEFRKRPVLARLVPVIRRLGAVARLDAGQAFVDVGDKADAAHLAVGDDVDAGICLAAHGLGDGALDARRERRLVDLLAALLPQDHCPQIVGPRQAADMRRQDTVGAASHDFLPRFAAA